MSEFIRFISQPWLGSLLGILGLAAALIFYLRSRQVTRFAYQHDNLSLVGGGDAAFPSELEIRFSGDVVPRVTSDRLVLWNAGNTTLAASKIVESDPVCLRLPSEETILKCQVLKVCREVNGCSVRVPKEKAHEAIIHFDFLDPGDGLAIEVLHTGGRESLQVDGTIRGIPKGISNYGRVRWFVRNRLRNLPFPLKHFHWNFPIYVTLILGLSMTAYGLLKPQSLDWFPSLAATDTAPTEFPRWGLVVGGLIYAALPAGMLWVRRRRYPGTLEFDAESDVE